MGQLYKLDFANGKSYIGITTRSAEERLHGHRARCRSNKGSNAALTGKKASDETRAKMSASAKANKKSPEHVAKLRISAAKARSVAAERRIK